VEDELRKLQKERSEIRRKGEKIIFGVLDLLKETDTEWEIKDVIIFVNGSDEISLDFYTGEVKQLSDSLSEVGQKCMEILIDEVKQKKKKWNRLERDLKTIKAKMIKLNWRG